jgi:DNA-binding MarR family transcriptional regulator
VKVQLDLYLPYRLSVASNAVSQLIAQTYEDRFGLNIPQWRLMAVLAEAGALSQRELTARTMMDKVTISRAAQSLVKRRLIARKADQLDGRSHRLALTGSGKRLYAEIAPLALRCEQALLAEIDPDDVPRMHRLLTKLEKSAERLLSAE